MGVGHLGQVLVINRSRGYIQQSLLGPTQKGTFVAYRGDKVELWADWRMYV